MVKEMLTLPDTRTAAQCMRAIHHPLRKKILEYLDIEEVGTVTDIYISLRENQSWVSQHLWILREVGILTTSKEGKYIYYSIDYDRLAYITDIAHEMNDTVQLLRKRTAKNE